MRRADSAGVPRWISGVFGCNHSETQVSVEPFSRDINESLAAFDHELLYVHCWRVRYGLFPNEWAVRADSE
jgi:hypothetical protein